MEAHLTLGQQTSLLSTGSLKYFNLTGNTKSCLIADAAIEEFDLTGSVSKQSDTSSSAEEFDLTGNASKQPEAGSTTEVFDLTGNASKQPGADGAVEQRDLTGKALERSAVGSRSPEAQTDPGANIEEFDITGNSPIQTGEEFDLSGGSKAETKRLQPKSKSNKPTDAPTTSEPEGVQVFDLSGPSMKAKIAPPASAMNAPKNPVAAKERSSSEIPNEPTLPSHATIVRVIDGDTYHLSTGDRVRLSGVNTPEKREHMGPLVTESVHTMLLGKKVELRYGPVARDHYGRLIARVYLEGKSMAEELLRLGLAHIFIIPPERPENYDQMVAAQREARAAQRGIWAERHYQGPLHITSFHANARGDDRENLAGEYLRIANISSGPLDLSGFTLTNRRGRTLRLPSLVIPEGYTFQVFSGRGEVEGSLEVTYKIYWNSDGPIWSNDGDRATLRDRDGIWIDEAVHAPGRRYSKPMR